MYREIQVVFASACIIYQLCIKVVYFLRFNIEENLGFFVLLIVLTCIEEIRSNYFILQKSLNIDQTSTITLL